MRDNIAALFAGIQAYKKDPDSFSAEKKEKLQKSVAAFLNDFCDGKEEFEADAAPELLMFLQRAKVFAELDAEIKSARKKLTSKLAEFDSRYGLSGLEDIDENLLESNIKKMDVFSQIPYKNRPEFQGIVRILQNIALTDENGNSLGADGNRRIEATVSGLAATDTFFSLLGSDNLTLNEYFKVLGEAMQVHLIALFYTEEVSKHFPLTPQQQEKAKNYMDKLIALIV